jgi:hypothetical protein
MELAETMMASDRNGWLALLTVLLLHMAATCYVLPPTAIPRNDSLPGYDYPVHTHRVYLTQVAIRERGLPWGYDPSLSAGLAIDPTQDTGKPQQVLGALLPFLHPATVVALFAFVAVLLGPMLLVLACLHMKLTLSVQAWVLISVLTPLWLMNGLLHNFMVFGMIAYLASVFASPWVMTRFLRFIDQPSLGRWAGFTSAGGFLFLLHIVGPMVIVIPLAVYTLLARPLAVRWRLATMLTPLIIAAINAFWFVPLMLALGMPRPPWALVPAQMLHKSFTVRNWAELAAHLTPLQMALYALGIGAASTGLMLLAKATGRRTAIVCGLAAFSCLFLGLFGSFVPVVVYMQPLRLLIPATVFLGLPVGVLVDACLRKIRVSPDLAAVVISVELAALTVFQGWLQPMQQTSASKTLQGFVMEHTSPGDRLLIQSLDWQTKAMPLSLGREVIGHTFPVLNDPIQFKANSVFGKSFGAWQSEELRTTLHRYGAAFVLTLSPEARALFAKTLGEPGKSVGSYQVFTVHPPTGRFLIGEGKVQAAFNRLELSGVQPERGLVVLRYRYHPAWLASNGQGVEHYPVPEDPAGFLALRDPPADLTLRFSPWAMLWTPWPALSN